MENRGFFATFEGCDGSGKTSVMNRVQEILAEQNIPVTSTREPGGVPIAEQIRAVILDPENTEMDVRTEVLLFAASRRQHLVEKILPALDAGFMVLSDRFVDSSLVYQGIAGGAGIDDVVTVNDYAIGGLWPDVTYFLDSRPERCLARIRGNSEHEDNRLDRETLDYHNRVYDGFTQLLKLYPERIVSIDGDRTIEEEAQEIASDLRRRWIERS